jgi:hypothetical protein
MKRGVLLAILFSSWAAPQTVDYVPDLTASASSQTARIKVDAEQNPTSSGVICSYHVTNGAAKPIYLFQVGAYSNRSGIKGLPAPPLRANQPSPGAIPAGWFGGMGSGPPNGFSRK